MPFDTLKLLLYEDQCLSWVLQSGFESLLQARPVLLMMIDDGRLTAPADEATESSAQRECPPTVPTCGWSTYLTLSSVGVAALNNHTAKCRIPRLQAARTADQRG